MLLVLVLFHVVSMFSPWSWFIFILVIVLVLLPVLFVLVLGFVLFLVLSLFLVFGLVFDLLLVFLKENHTIKQPRWLLAVPEALRMDTVAAFDFDHCFGPCSGPGPGPGPCCSSQSYVACKFERRYLMCLNHSFVIKILSLNGFCRCITLTLTHTHTVAHTQAVLRPAPPLVLPLV